MINYYFSKNYISFGLGSLIELYIENPFKTIKKVKNIFKPLKWKFFLCKRNFIPIIYCSSHLGKILNITIQDVMWKDKFDTPRLEESPYIVIFLFNYAIGWKYCSKGFFYDDDYWEQVLWYLYYYKEYKMKVPDIIEAEKYWPWKTYSNSKISTWEDKFLIK